MKYLQTSNPYWIIYKYYGRYLHRDWNISILVIYKVNWNDPERNNVFTTDDIEYSDKCEMLGNEDTSQKSIESNATLTF